ncbi:MAG: hypothetical protein EPO32_11765 [Anaerolineae bacterium]|nr:MAG: hypothetical protein EPO32_11765 [Anaerolineae bacterium]
MLQAHDRKFYFITLAVFLLALSLPYAVAFRAAAPEYVFTGFLLKAEDNNTYLAKMRQGWEGSWRFRLPYVFETGPGGPVHLPYLFLGHLARWLSLPLLAVFHAARLLAAAFLLWALNEFMAALFPPGAGRRWAFLLAAFGAGLGWVAMVAGWSSPDLWVAEIYPFLSSYTNVHFPAALGLQLFLLAPEETALDARRAIGFGVLAALLTLVSAYSLPVVVTVWATLGVWRWARREPSRPAFSRALLAGLSGGAVLLFHQWAIAQDPLLVSWSAQNFTPMRPLGEMLLGLLPVAALAIPGAWRALRGDATRWHLPALWLLACQLLALAPIAVQRRFLVGYFVPLAALAMMFIGERLREVAAGRARLGLFAAAGITNLMILITAFFVAQVHLPQAYLTTRERAAYAWLDANLPAGARLLAGPETGLFIPAYTGLHVYYGHPHETIDAENKLIRLNAFFAAPSFDFVEEIGAQYLFYGPRERALGPVLQGDGLQRVYAEAGVEIYRVAAP